MTLEIINRTGANGNTHVRILTNDASEVSDYPCGVLGVHLVTSPNDPDSFEIRGAGYHRTYTFKRADVISPASASDTDLLDKITDVLNCCACAT